MRRTTSLSILARHRFTCTKITLRVTRHTLYLSIILSWTFSCACINSDAKHQHCWRWTFFDQCTSKNYTWRRFAVQECLSAGSLRIGYKCLKSLSTYTMLILYSVISLDHESGFQVNLSIRMIITPRICLTIYALSVRKLKNYWRSFDSLLVPILEYRNFVGISYGNNFGQLSVNTVLPRNGSLQLSCNNKTRHD